MMRSMSIFRFPKILVIHLKRFYNTKFRREKLTNSIEIPMNLDMTEYGQASNHRSKASAASYNLYGISHHSGTLNGGHYIGEVMNIDNSSWYKQHGKLCTKQKRVT